MHLNPKVHVLTGETGVALLVDAAGKVVMRPGPASGDKSWVWLDTSVNIAEQALQSDSR